MYILFVTLLKEKLICSCLSLKQTDFLLKQSSTGLTVPLVSSFEQVSLCFVLIKAAHQH